MGLGLQQVPWGLRHIHSSRRTRMNRSHTCCSHSHMQQGVMSRLVQREWLGDQTGVLLVVHSRRRQVGLMLVVSHSSHMGLVSMSSHMLPT